jgi:hypothetical protein
MSWVQNVIISAHRSDRANLNALAAWLREHPAEYLDRARWGRPEDFDPDNIDRREWPYSGDLAEIPRDAWPGPKYAECNVWIGVLNGADLGQVRARVMSIPWRVPNAVQLFLMDQEERFFRMWMIRGGSLREYPPDKPDENSDDFWGDYFLNRGTEQPRGSG